MKVSLSWYLPLTNESLSSYNVSCCNGNMNAIDTGKLYGVEKVAPNDAILKRSPGSTYSISRFNQRISLSVSCRSNAPIEEFISSKFAGPTTGNIGNGR